MNLFRSASRNVKSSSSTSMSTTTTNVRIVTYNVLSSQLAQASHYPTLNPDHLEADRRLPVVLDKLQRELTTTAHNNNNHHHQTNNVIVCLQEVALDWEGPLHVWFARRGYHVVAARYGKPFNGYMGVLLAWPTATLELVDLDIVRLADQRQDWPKTATTSTSSSPHVWLQQWGRGLWSWIQTVVSSGNDDDKEETPPDHWNLSQHRHNQLIAARLRDTRTRQEFVVGTYHMPCAYYCPMAMTIHADMAARFVEQMAERTVVGASKTKETDDDAADDDNDGKEPPPSDTTSVECIPFVLAGDFNLKPFEPVYNLLTTGHLDRHGPFYPTAAVTTNSEGEETRMEWCPTLQRPLASAYAAFDAEPDFTNYAKAGDNLEEPPFIETLDYIFVSPQWKVESVLPIPPRDEAQGPFPNLDVNEPSDHVLIAADLVLSSSEPVVS